MLKIVLTRVDVLSGGGAARSATRSHEQLPEDTGCGGKRVKSSLFSPHQAVSPLASSSPEEHLFSSLCKVSV